MDMPRRRTAQPESPLYVRLPATASDKLDRAAEALGVAKKDLVAGLVTRYVHPDSERGLDALGALSQPRRGAIIVDGKGPTMGAYSFRPYDASEPQAYEAPKPPEVMNAKQTAKLLQIDKGTVIELAEAGTLPGRKLGAQWRFSRTAVLAWLAGAQR